MANTHIFVIEFSHLNSFGQVCTHLDSEFRAKMRLLNFRDLEELLVSRHSIAL
jgi:hypothetical protein